MTDVVVVRDVNGGFVTKSLGKGLSSGGGAIGADVAGVAAKTAISTVGAGTLTAAALVSGLIMRTGPVGGYTDTTDTATAILAAMDSPAIGDSFDFIHVNGVAQACTLAAGAGVTLAGTVNNAASKVRMYRATVTAVSTPAVTITGIGEMVA